MSILKPWQISAWVTLCAALALSHTAIATPITENTTVVSRELSTLVRQQLVNHPQLLALKADLHAAKAGLRAADQAIYNPELEFDYEDSDVETKTIGISQTLDWGNQRGSRTGVAEAGLGKAKADYKVASQSFINTILTGLAEHQTHHELAGLSLQSLALMENFKRIAEQRHQAGDLSQVELNLARLAYNQAIMDQATRLSNATEARENLRSLFEYLPATLPSLPEKLPEPKLEQDLEAFLQALPAVRAQLAEIQAIKQTVALRKSEQAWNPTISVTAGTEGDDNLLGLNLSIPLNIRNTYSAEVDAAQQQLVAREQRAHLAYRQYRATLIATTERYRNLLKAWNNWREYSRSSVDQQLILIKQLWQAGDISASDYLLQLKQALDTQASGLALRNQLWQVAFTWMSQTNSIDNWLKLDNNAINTHQ